jgi:hypothetical protein
MDDPTNPSHYTAGGVECIEAIEASMSEEAFRGFMKGNCIKYLWRYERKNGAEDLRKAQWYLQRLAEEVDADEKLNEPIDTEKFSDEVYKEVKAMEEREIDYDPDDYMASGCPGGFCPMPDVRQGPPEIMFQPVS